MPEDGFLEGVETCCSKGYVGYETRMNTLFLRVKTLIGLKCKRTLKYNIKDNRIGLNLLCQC
jgi:hypothetical protein